MSQKRLNKKVVVGLTLTVFACMILLSVLMLGQLRQRDPQHFVTLAQTYGRTGQWHQAATLYLKAWDRGHDPLHLVSAGEMLLKEGEVRDALQVWQEALLGKPDLVEAHEHLITLQLKLAEIYGSSNDWREVRDAAEAMLATSGTTEDKNRAFARHALGMALTHLTKQEEDYRRTGTEALKEAVRLAPQVVDYALDLAAWYIQEKRPDEGQALLHDRLESSVSTGADASKVHLAYARFLSRRRAEGEDVDRYHDRLEQAGGYFEQAVALAEKEGSLRYDARVAQAVFLSQQWSRSAVAKPDDADALFSRTVTLLKEAIAANPDAYEAYVQLGSLFYRTQKPDQVLEVCKQRLSRGLSRKGVEAARHKAYTFQLMLLGCEACIAKATTASKSGDTTTRDQWLSQARTYRDRAGGEWPDHPRLLTESARIKLMIGQDREALHDLRQAEEGYRLRNAMDWENKMLLVRLHLRLNEPGPAKAILEPVIDRARGAGATAVLLLYARVLFQNGEFDNPALRRVLAEVLVRDPGNTDVKRIQAALNEQQGQLPQAIELTSSHATAALLKAKQLALGGDSGGALRVLQGALEQAPAHFWLVATTVNELLRLQRVEQAAAVVRRAIKADPENTALKKLEVATRPKLSSEERQQALIEITKTEPDLFQRARDLADLYLRAKDFANALHSLNEAEQHLIRKDTPAARTAIPDQHRALLMSKLRAAGLLNDDKSMTEARDAARKFNVDGAGGKSIQGIYHMQRKEFDLAIRALREAIQIQDTDVTALTYLGLCLQQKGEGEKARPFWDRAVRINPHAVLAHKGLAVLAEARGDADAWERHLRVCERMIPEDPWVRQAILLRKEHKDPRRAIADREAKLAEAPDDTANLFRLAVLCEQVGDWARAKSYYKQLLKLQPDNRNLVVRSAQFYRRVGEPKKALALVTQFAASRTLDAQRADAQILVAAHYLSEGNVSEAEKTLLAASRIAQTLEVCRSLGEFYLRSKSQADKALQWFDRAVEPARQDGHRPQLEQVLANRVACVLSQRGGDMKLARRLVGEFHDEFPKDPRGVLWDGEVHAREGDSEQAIALFTSYLAQVPDSAYALYQRAQLLTLRGRVPAAMDDLEAIRHTHPRALQLKPRLRLAQLYRQVGRKDAWIHELEVLAQDAPDAPAALVALARAYLWEGRFSDADGIVTAQINRSDTDTNSRWYLLRGLVSLKLKEPDKALADFQRAAKIDHHSGESIARVLDVYLQLQRFAKGTAYYESHKPADEIHALALSHYARLLAGSGRSEQAVPIFRRAMDLAVDESIQAVRAVTSDIPLAFPRIEDAVRTFEQTPVDDTLSGANDRILSRLYPSVSRIDDAIATLERLLPHAGEDARRVDLLLDLGDLYQMTQRWEEARKAYEQALQLDPDNWILLNNLAFVLADALGEQTLARTYAEKAVRISDNADTLDTLGWVYAQLGDYEPAVSHLHRSIQLRGDLALTYYHLVQAYRRGRRFSEAADTLVKGFEVARSSGNHAAEALLDDVQKRIKRRDSSL